MAARMPSDSLPRTLRGDRTIMRHHLTCRSIGAAAQWLAIARDRRCNPSAARMVDSNMSHIGHR